MFNNSKNQKMKNQIIVLFKGFQKLGEFENLEKAKIFMDINSTEGINIFNFLFCEKTENNYKVVARTSEVVKK